MADKKHGPIRAELLTAFWETLNRPPRIGRPQEAAAYVQEQALRDGWVGLMEFEDYLVEAEAMPLGGKLADMLAVFGIVPRGVFRRPQSKATSVWGGDRVEAFEAADFLIQHQRLGFDVDPGPLCEALRPALLKARFLTASQISVLWYARERYRMHPLLLTTGGSWPRRGGSESVTTTTGYTVERQCADDGETFGLTARPPRGRRRLRTGMDAFT